MQKIAIDCRMIGMSGIGTYLKNIIPGILKTKRFNVSCLGYEDLKEFDWFAEVNYIHLKAKILSFHEQIELPLKIPNCDLFWSPNWNAPIFPIRAKFRLVTIHDVYHLAHPVEFSGIKRIILKSFMNHVINISDKVITVSNFSKSEIVKLTSCPPKKVEVIPLAVSNDFNKKFIFKPILDKYILFVGNVKPHKNLYNSLIAFNKSKHKELKFYIVGQRDGFINGAGSTLNDLIKENDKVVFTGRIDDETLKNYYANASLFLFPSKYEGFGLPLLEAMRFNLPILASNAASIPEVAGDNVTFFDPNNPIQLCGKIDEFFEEDQIIIENRYKDHLSKFDWDITVNKHIRAIVGINENTSDS